MTTARATAADLPETAKPIAKAPAKRTTTKKAPAKTAPAPAAPVVEASTKKPSIRWSYEGERGEKTTQVGTSPVGTYRITPDGDKWQVTVEREDGKQTTLADGISHGGAYAKAVADFKTEVAK